MRLLLSLAALALPFAAAASSPAPAPRRIVSLYLCADQYLLTLADPEQIVALSRFARDPGLSEQAARAAAFPLTGGSAEEVLKLRPDLLLTGSGGAAGVLAGLSGRNVATLELSTAQSYDEIKARIREVAAAVGHPARGEALIARMDARLARVPRGAGRGRVAAYYQRRGYLTGSGTLIDELMHRVGLANLATRLGRPALSRVSLEQIVRARPDLLLVETATERVTDQGTEMLHHPALSRIPRLSLPQAWTVCGGPGYVWAAERLSRQLAGANAAR